MKLSNNLFIPHLGEFIAQSVLLEIFYIFNFNYLKILLIVMKPVILKSQWGSTKICLRNLAPKIFCMSN